MDGSPVEDLDAATVATMKRLLTTDPVPPLKGDRLLAHLRRSGTARPSAQGPPAIYCPGAGCAPSRGAGS